MIPTSDVVARKPPPEVTRVRPRGSVVDLFCGAGGLAHGFKLERFDVVAGYDVDEACRYPFEHNNHAPFVRRDVSDLGASELNGLFYPGEPRILVGCAPCQPFSIYNSKNDDPKWRLVSKFADLIVEAQPDVVSMENVPRLLAFDGGRVFEGFAARLRGAGYHVHHEIVYLPNYGLAQRRSRLVLLASRLGPIRLEAPTTPPEQHATVWDAIGDLPPIGAGETHPADRIHVSAGLTEINLRRIRASRPGGTWREWDEDLVADCHKTEKGRSYDCVYSRMRADHPAPTITTQFYGFGTGRFGHPEQDRALSIREGAILQSFPRDYAFVKPGDQVRVHTLGRMIGNAVPVLLGRAIARSVEAHIREANA